MAVSWAVPVRLRLLMPVWTGVDMCAIGIGAFLSRVIRVEFNLLITAIL